MYLGKLRKIEEQSVSDEYISLSAKDENAANILLNNKCFRQAAYMYIQSMEKLIRAKIFTKINPTNENFISMNRNHSIENAVELLITVINTDDNVKNQIKNMICNDVLKNIDFKKANSNLRYPYYNFNKHQYNIIDISYDDCILFKKMLDNLKKYINDLYRL